MINLILSIILSLIPNKQDVKEYLIEKEIPIMWLNVAYLETQIGKTGVGSTHNNLFGLRYTKNYHYFKTWQLSVDSLDNMIERKLSKHIKNNHKNTSCDSTYCFFLSIGWRSGKPYSQPEKVYINKLKRLNL